MVVRVAAHDLRNDWPADSAANVDAHRLLRKANRIELGEDIRLNMVIRIYQDKEFRAWSHVVLDLLDDQIRHRAPPHDERAFADRFDRSGGMISRPGPWLRLAIEHEHRIVLRNADRLVPGHDDGFRADRQ